jgi:hypothetical protein
MQLLNLLNGHHVEKLVSELGAIFLSPNEQVKEFSDIVLYLVPLCKFAIIIICYQFIE